jgi:translation initiation factor 2 subunit 3
LHWRESLPEWYIEKYGYQPCVNIGTAGHVDHGKTTLVQALTGQWTSVHSQELKRGITIRVGYSDAAFYKCPSCEDPLGYSTVPRCNNCGSESELTRVVSFVDSPGHESLMANMLSGSALMDGALLLVAANEKVPRPQTKEHMLALQTLGIRQIVVVQNKVDLISYEDALACYADIAEFVGGLDAADLPVIPVSAQSNLNVDALIATIESTIKTPDRDDEKDAVMQVLRSFDVNRPGSNIADIKGGVIGGSLTGGTLVEGDEIEIKPGVAAKRGSYEPLFTEIVSLGTSAGTVGSVRPGGLVAIGTKLDPSMTRRDSLVGGGVIGGSLTGGTLVEGDEIEIKPGVAAKRGSYEPLFTEIVSLGTSAGTVGSVRPGGLVAIGTKLDPSMTRRDSLVGSVIGRPGTLPDNTTSAQITISLFDSAVGSVDETKVLPIQNGESLRLNIGTAPVLSKVTKVKGDRISVEFRRPVCLFESDSVAISRRIADRWRLIGAGSVG